MGVHIQWCFTSQLRSLPVKPYNLTSCANEYSGYTMASSWIVGKPSGGYLIDKNSLQLSSTIVTTCQNKTKKVWHRGTYIWNKIYFKIFWGVEGGGGWKSKANLAYAFSKQGKIVTACHNKMKKVWHRGTCIWNKIYLQNFWGMGGRGRLEK